MQVQYSIFFFMNTVVMLCFLNSLVKNFDLSSVLPVDPVTYIMTNITFFFGWNLHLLPGMKPVTSSSPEIYLAIMWIQKHGLYASGECHDIVLSEHQNQSCWAWQTQIASRSACPACQTERAKTGNESSARRGIWDLSLARSVLGCEGMNPIFHACEMLFLSTNGPFNFVMPKYIKLRLSH